MLRDHCKAPCRGDPPPKGERAPGAPGVPALGLGSSSSPLVQTSSPEPSPPSCADLHQPDSWLAATAPNSSPKLDRGNFPCAGTGRRREHPALRRKPLLPQSLHALLFLTVPCCLLWQLTFLGAGASRDAGHLACHQLEPCSGVVSHPMLFLSATQFFSPWLNHLKTEAVCSHVRSSCFVCVSRKGNLGFSCSAAHSSLLQSIADYLLFCEQENKEE